MSLLFQPNAEIIIKVFDENRKMSKDFFCEKSLLANKMAYFKSYLTDHVGKDVEISVHCDISIFEWLMRHIKAEKGEEPRLSIRNVVSIIISSEFLQMSELVNSGLVFFKDNFGDILKVPIELSCMNDSLVGKLADLFSLTEIANLEDTRDKILSRLYFFKLDSFLRVNGFTINRCLHCGKMYCNLFQDLLECSNSKLSIGLRGEFQLRHTPSKKFRPKKYISALRLLNISWNDIFWHVWGLTVLFPCSQCVSYFSVSYFSFCRCHRIATQSDKFSCCNAATTGSIVLDNRSGCVKQSHTLNPLKPIISLEILSDAEIMRLFFANLLKIIIPCSDGKEDDALSICNNFYPTKDFVFQKLGVWLQRFVSKREQKKIAVTKSSKKSKNGTVFLPLDEPIVTFASLSKHIFEKDDPTLFSHPYTRLFFTKVRGSSKKLTVGLVNVRKEVKRLASQDADPVDDQEGDESETPVSETDEEDDRILSWENFELDDNDESDEEYLYLKEFSSISSHELDKIGQIEKLPVPKSPGPLKIKRMRRPSLKNAISGPTAIPIQVAAERSCLLFFY